MKENVCDAISQSCRRGQIICRMALHPAENGNDRPFTMSTRFQSCANVQN